MGDEQIRAGLANLPVPTFESPAFTPAPALKDAVVAVVTSAGLRRPGEPTWMPNDPSFRVFETEERNLCLGHVSPNFDRSGLASDLNVVYPVERLEEMAAEGIIAGVAPRHMSFMGAQDETMTSIRMDTGPAAAKQLKDDGVNVVLLTPI